jgi:hypothetical protein
MGLIHLHLTLSCVSPCEVTFHSQAFYFICIGGVMVSVLAWSVVDCGFIGGVMVSVLAWSVVDCGFESRSGQTQNYKIGICCFSARHTALRRKSKDWLARNQDNFSEKGNKPIRRLLFQ